MTPRRLIELSKDNALTERSSAQSQFLDVCKLVERGAPKEFDPTGEFFTFEKDASKTGGIECRAALLTMPEVDGALGVPNTGPRHGANQLGVPNDPHAEERPKGASRSTQGLAEAPWPEAEFIVGNPPCSVARSSTDEALAKLLTLNLERAAAGR